MAVFKTVAEVSANVFKTVTVWSSFFRYINIFSFLLKLGTYPLSYRVPVRERYGSTLLPATREQHVELTGIKVNGNSHQCEATIHKF